MKAMTFQEWASYYERRAEPLEKPPGYSLLFEPENGFMYYRIEGDAVLVDHTATHDMDYWHERARKIARANGKRYVVTQTIRCPKAYARKSKAHLDLLRSGVRANGRFYWVFVEEV